MGRLDGKVAVVTGAASGIGRATSIMFAREGARLLVADQNADGVSETAALIAQTGGTAQPMVGDAGHEASVKGFIAGAVSAFGALDIVHANAGVSGGRVPIFEQTEEYWRQILQINLIGSFLAIKHAGMQMVKHGRGSIILTASVAGLAANAGAAAYSASKAGVISLAQTAAASFLGTGVRVNAICPGLIETGMTKPFFDSVREAGKEDKIGQLNPLQRAGQPDEIAAMALFLASERQWPGPRGRWRTFELVALLPAASVTSLGPPCAVFSFNFRSAGGVDRSHARAYVPAPQHGDAVCVAGGCS